MARVVDHLSVDELGRRWRTSADAVEARHFQAIWHLAQGRTLAETARLTGFVQRWLEELLSRYNVFGASALGDQRRRNGRAPTVLTPTALAKLKARLESEPDGGGLWTSKKAAAFIATELGLETVSVQRGWEALRAVGHTRQRPRPRHTLSASPQEQGAFKKNSPTRSRTSARPIRTPS
jgi:transposase